MNEALTNGAKRLIGDDAFKLVMDSLKEETKDLWARTNPDEADARDDLYYLYLAFSHLENRLISLANNDKFTAAKEKQVIDA